MCQSKAEGGKRCPCDSSAQRRLRRKSAEALALAARIDRFLPEDSDLLKSEELPSALRRFRREWDEGTREGEDIESFENRMEREMTLVGMSVMRAAEDEYGFEPESEEDREELARLRAKIARADEDIEHIWNVVQKDAYDYMTLVEKHNNAYEDSAFKDAEMDIIRYTFFYTSPNNLKEQNKTIQKLQEYMERSDEPLAQEYCRKAIEILDQRHDYLYSGRRENSEHMVDELEKRKSELSEQANEITAKAKSRSILKKLGDLRAMGGQARFASASDETLSSQLQENVDKHYPSAWIEHHNNGESVVIQEIQDDDTSSAPAYYTSKATFENEVTEKEYEAGQLQEIATHTFSEGELGFFEHHMGRQGIRHATFSSGGPATMLMGSNSMSVFASESGMSKELPDGVDADLWEEAPNYSVSHLHQLYTENPDITDAEVDASAQSNKLWKPKRKINRRVGHAMRFDTKSLKGLHMVDSTMTHEMGHRMEDALPDGRLFRMERAFLDRRSGGSDAVSLHGGDQITRKTNISTGRYSSRIYPFQDNREVFTTGMESAFYGCYQDNGSLDSDHEAFTIGAFAAL